MTVVDVAGVIYWQGLSLEPATCIMMILSCGLSLDYSAHIGVSYLTSQGSTRLGELRLCEIDN